jgi:hypothetical protein
MTIAALSPAVTAARPRWCRSDVGNVDVLVLARHHRSDPAERLAGRAIREMTVRGILE